MCMADIESDKPSSLKVQAAGKSMLEENRAQTVSSQAIKGATGLLNCPIKLATAIKHAELPLTEILTPPLQHAQG